jgi:hypothetical protein
LIQKFLTFIFHKLIFDQFSYEMNKIYTQN